jgi:uncharacterized protein YcfJ
MKICLPAFVLFTSVLLCLPASAQRHTERGALLGGVSGALIGGAIGDQNDETAEGALIGGAVGLLSGSLIGNSLDAQEAQARARYQQHITTQVSRAVSISDVITMTQNGIGDLVIMDRLQQYGVQRRLEVADVIMLHRQGVSEQVITAMQQARLAGSVPAAPQPTYRAPVVVERHHYVAPPRFYSYPAPRYYYRHYPHPRHHHAQPHIHFGFSVRH